MFSSAIKKLNDFCSLPPLTDEMAAQVVELSAFKSMKTDPKSNYSWLDDVRVLFYTFTLQLTDNGKALFSRFSRWLKFETLPR